MRKTIFILLLFFLLFPKITYAAYCNPDTELSHGMDPYFIAQSNYYGHTSQGMCVAGDYIIYTRFRSDSLPTTYVILDAKTKKEIAHQEFKTLHSNSLTYNPDTKEVVSVSKNHAYVFSFKKHTLTLEHTYILNHNCCKIAYVPSKKLYYLGTSNVIYSSKDCKSLSPVFEVPQIAVNQGMGSDGKYLYVVWYTVGKNYLYKYSLDGSLVEKYTLFSDTYREIEEIDFLDDQMILNIANSPDHNGLYTIDPKHAYGKWKQTLNPTCAKEGEKVKVCKNCGNEKKESIPPTGEHKEGKWILTQRPDCEHPGQRIKQCKVCGQTTLVDELPEKGHRFTEWKTEVEPTVLKNGMGLRKCLDCGKAEYKVLPQISAIANFSVEYLPIQWHKSSAAPDIKLNKGDYIIEWTSKDPSIVSVSQNGKLTAKKHGTTKICVETAGGATDSFNVKVQFFPIWIKDIRLKDDILSLKKGNTKEIIAKKYPMTSWNHIRYFSKNPEIAEVSKDGIVSGKEKGETTIIVSSFRIRKELKVIVRK